MRAFFGQNHPSKIGGGGLCRVFRPVQPCFLIVRRSTLPSNTRDLGGIMRKRLLLAIAIAFSLASPVLWAQQKKALEVYFIDVEGGQSTLFVSPSGQSLLVDTGWPGARDSGRIVSIAKLAGVSQIDYLVLTHYHADHAGGVVDLARLIPIKNFVDHGPSAEEARNVPQNYAAYLTVRGKGQHILVK